jgi:hypothetical protein
MTFLVLFVPWWFKLLQCGDEIPQTANCVVGGVGRGRGVVECVVSAELCLVRSMDATHKEPDIWSRINGGTCSTIRSI